MAHQKSRASKSRTLKRRSTIKAEVPTFMSCTNCGTPVLYHHVCPECGFYKGKLAIEKSA